MPKYLDTDNDSSVTAYQVTGKGMRITFDGSVTFYYNEADHVRKMKRLAKKGDGLNAYINVNKPRKRRVRRK